MKEILNFSSIVLLFIVIFSCEKDFDNNENLIGSWKILTPDNDTLTFSESYFSRNYFNGLDHSFEYSCNKDSIIIQYTGPNMILVQPTTHHYELKENVLLIDFTNGCYGFNSMRYNLTKIE